MSKEQKKSTHLKDLEGVFDERVRRLRPFAALGLVDDPAPTSVPDSDTPTSNKEVDAPDRDISNISEDMAGLPVDRSISDRGTNNLDRDISTESISDMSRDIPDISIDRYDPNRNTPLSDRDIPVENKDIHDMSQDMPDLSSSGPVSTRDIHIFDRDIHAPNEDISAMLRDMSNSPMNISVSTRDATVLIRDTPLSDAMVAVRLGAQLGEKARQVLSYLNAIRSPESQSYTIPIGYSRIHEETGVSVNYLRNRILPKLAKVGLVTVVRKGLEGTVYHLLHGPQYIQFVVSGEMPSTPQILEHHLEPRSAERKEKKFLEGPDRGEKPKILEALPKWIDREYWGQLSLETTQHLIRKAGSEERAAEVLQIIQYNETHGPEHLRVTDRDTALACYLASSEADIWPNDSEYETLEIRRVRVRKELAQKEKQIAEEALKARQEANRAKFLASLSETQLRWIKQEAKRRVDNLPASQLDPTRPRYTSYKAEENQIVEEWMDRMAYGETVPAVLEDIDSPVPSRYSGEQQLQP